MLITKHEVCFYYALSQWEIANNILIVIRRDGQMTVLRPNAFIKRCTRVQDGDVLLKVYFDRAPYILVYIFSGGEARKIVSTRSTTYAVTALHNTETVTEKQLEVLCSVLAYLAEGKRTF